MINYYRIPIPLMSAGMIETKVMVIYRENRVTLSVNLVWYYYDFRLRLNWCPGERPTINVRLLFRDTSV